MNSGRQLLECRNQSEASDVEQIAQTIPTWDELFRIAPTSMIIISIFIGGGVFVWWLTRGEVKALREFNEYLKQQK